MSDDIVNSAGEIVNPPEPSRSSKKKKVVLPKPTDEEAEREVRVFALEEQQRRQWCVGQALSAWNLETTENNFLRLADKIYEYVYGRRQP